MEINSILLVAVVLTFGRVLYMEWRLKTMIKDAARICGEDVRAVKKSIRELNISQEMRAHKFRFRTGQKIKDWEVIHRHTRRINKRDVFEQPRFRVDFDAFYLVARIDRVCDNADFETFEVEEDTLTQYSKEDVFLV